MWNIAHRNITMTARANHRNFLPQMPRAGNATGNFVAARRRAALAVRHNFILASSVTDFDRFASLKWRSPIR